MHVPKHTSGDLSIPRDYDDQPRIESDYGTIAWIVVNDIFDDDESQEKRDANQAARDEARDNAERLVMAWNNLNH